jgi:HAD superfamily hydrolase (TIGR01509 family)
MSGLNAGTSRIDKIKALILDFDGLILDTETSLLVAWKEILDEYGITVAPGTWAGLLGTSADPPGAYELLEDHLKTPVDREVLRKRRMQRELELLEQQGPMRGVRGLIERARARGLALAVASSSSREWVEAHLSNLDLLGDFDTIRTSDDVARTKPAPDLYHAVLMQLDLAAGEAIAFEDSYHGVSAAKSAGLFTVAVPNDVTRHLAMPHADLVVDHIDDRSLDEYLLAAIRG